MTTNNKVTFGDVKYTKILSSLVNIDNVHKSSKVGYICLDFAINLNK